MWRRGWAAFRGQGGRDVPPQRGGGSEGVSHMMAARALAVSAGKAAGLQRPARPPQRSSMHVYRRAPAGYQFALPLYRPTRRSLASWFGSACVFGLKLLASGLAGVLVATALWHDQWKSASAPATAPATTSAPDGTTRTTTGAATTTTTTTTTSASKHWYPDHAVYNATKDELKAMPEFKY